MVNYVLSYDPVAGNYSVTQLAAFIRENRKLVGWYSPFLGTYLLKSNDTLVSLTESFRPFFDGSAYVLTFASMTGGALAPEIWNWFNTGIVPAALTPPVPPTAKLF